MDTGRSRSRTNSVTSILSSGSSSNKHASHLLQLKRRQDIHRTIKELTSTKKRLSDSNLTTNDTIEFFTKIKNKRIKSSSLTNNPSYNKFNTYNPYDRKKLLQRINTYNILNWSIDDEDCELNPLTCARFGWSCVENNGSIKNQLRCHTCNATMILKLNNNNSNEVMSNDFNDFFFKFDEEDEQVFESDVNRELVAKYLEKLSSEHNDSCPWKTHPSPLSSYQIQSYDYQDTLHHLKKIINQLNDNKDYIFVKSYKKILADEELLLLQKWTDFQYTDEILVISLLGWELKVQTFSYNQLLFLQCHSCNRRVLIGNIKGGIFNVNDVTLNLTPSKILAGTVYPLSFDDVEGEDDDDKIDLFNEHKNWCALKTGYKTLLQFL